MPRELVILDRNDYIDKVESNLSDGSFDILSSDPSLSFYHTVKDWGDKWVEKGEITQPLVDCILNVNARPGKNYGLIKTQKPNNPIRLITSGNGTAVENLSLFTEYFLHPCVKKEPQILIDTTALSNKIADINNKFSPFPAGALLVSWDVISMYPSIDNKVGLAACKEALDSRDIGIVGISYLPVQNACLKLSKLHLNVIIQLLTINTTIKIEVQQWGHTMLVAMLI